MQDKIDYDWDFEYTNNPIHYISIFEVKTGKVVDYAESTEEALEKIANLEKKAK